MRRVFSVVVCLSVLFFNGLAADAKTSARVYVEKFQKLNTAADNEMAALLRDLKSAYGPQTPPEEVAQTTIAIAGDRLDFEAQQRILVDAQGKRKQFLNSPEGKAWVARRTALRKQIVKTLPARLASIRKKIRAIDNLSPVPASMERADIAVSAYVKSLNDFVDAIKRTVHLTTTEGAVSKAVLDNYDARRANVFNLMGLE